MQIQSDAVTGAVLDRGSVGDFAPVQSIATAGEHIDRGAVHRIGGAAGHECIGGGNFRLLDRIMHRQDRIGRFAIDHRAGAIAPVSEGFVTRKQIDDDRHAGF